MKVDNLESKLFNQTLASSKRMRAALQNENLRRQTFVNE